MDAVSENRKIMNKDSFLFNSLPMGKKIRTTIVKAQTNIQDGGRRERRFSEEPRK